MKRISIIWAITLTTLAPLHADEPKEEDMKKTYTYTLLPAGAIQPGGWIKQQLKQDLTEGYIGQFDQVHPTVTHDVFTRPERRSKRKFSMRKEWWSGEHEGYWKDAVTRMAFLTGEQAYIDRATGWINELLDSINDAGYIGIYEDCNEAGCRFNHSRGNGELWVTSRMLMALLAYYEYTGRQEVLTAAEKAVQLVMDHYRNRNYFAVTSKGGGVSHGIGFFENLEWLYRITGKRQYLTFAKKLYSDFNKVDVRDDDLQTSNLLKEDLLFKSHGAHTAEGLFVPQMIASLKKEEKYDEAATHVLEKLDTHTTPSGAMRCDEWIKQRLGTADERYEYCGIAEMVSPLNKMISFTGDFSLADRIETMTFNAGQGSRLPVLKALSYLTKDNRIKINHREIVKRENYDAAHMAAACCVLNGGRLMPYYVEGMWMKDPQKDGLIAALYGPNTLDTKIAGVPVQISEDTHYPFNDTVTFTIQPGKPVSFPLTLRKPFGCEVSAVKLPENARLEEKPDRLVLENTWKPGDQVEIVFNFTVNKIQQPASKTVKNKGIYFKRGPLVFALPFDHRIKKVKEYRNSGYHRYRIRATDRSGWNYTIQPANPVEFVPGTPEEMNTPWEKPVLHMKVWLKNKKGTLEPFNLVPMGNTVFRRVTFSVR